jgi:anti-sigma factor RsiW
MPSEPSEWLRRRQLQCEDIADLLPGIIDGDDATDKRIVQHVESCLRCQAELVQYRRLVRALHQMRTDLLEPAPGVLSDILAGLAEAGEQRVIQAHLRGHRAVYISGMAVATAAAGAAGAVVLVSRASRRKMRLAG